MLYWVTLDETLSNGKTYTTCLTNDGKEVKALEGESKTDVLNVPASCVFTDWSVMRSKLDDYASALCDLGLIKLFKIQIHQYGY